MIQPGLPLGDPHICSDDKDRVSLISAIYEALVEMGGPGIYKPSLAEAWRTDRDASIWEFRLRRDALFHNKHQLDSDDVTASLERVRSPKVGGILGTKGVYASYLDNAKFEAVNVDRVRVTLKEPMADLLDLLSAMPIVPEDVLDDLPEEHIGSGPYMVNDLDEDKVTMTAHLHHWRGKPTYRRLRWLAEPDEEERIKALTHEANVATGLSPEGSKHTHVEGTQIESRLGSMCIIYLLNCLKGPCRGKRVRRALNLAIDRDEIVDKIMYGCAEPLTGPLTPLHLGWDPDVPGFRHDPDEARQLLRDAGYSDGLTLKMDTPNESPDEAIPLSRMIAEQYKNVGIQIELRVYQDRSDYSEMVRNKKIGDLCCFDSSPLSTFRVLREKIHSKLQGPWWEGYSNPEVDALTEKAQRTTDEEERRITYLHTYNILADDAPWLFIYRPEYNWAVKPGSDWTPSWDCVVRVT